MLGTTKIAGATVFVSQVVVTSPSSCAGVEYEHQEKHLSRPQ